MRRLRLTTLLEQVIPPAILTYLALSFRRALGTIGCKQLTPETHAHTNTDAYLYVAQDRPWSSGKLHQHLASAADNNQQPHTALQ